MRKCIDCNEPLSHAVTCLACYHINQAMRRGGLVAARGNTGRAFVGYGYDVVGGYSGINALIDIMRNGFYPE